MSQARSKIIRVWGTADTFDIEFTFISGIEWKCSIPPDTADGVYAVELFAMNELQETTHWTGELFMCNGVCHLKLFTQKYNVWFKKTSSIRLSDKLTNIIFKGCYHI